MIKQLPTYYCGYEKQNQDKYEKSKNIQHFKKRLQSISHFCVKPSKQIKGENGLFANQDYNHHDIITWYDGQIISFNDYFIGKTILPTKFRSHVLPLVGWKYVILGNVQPTLICHTSLKDFKVFSSDVLVDADYKSDGKFKNFGAGSFINHSDFNDNVFPILLEFTEAQEKASENINPITRLWVIVTMRKIKKGEELLMTYNEDHWKQFQPKKLRFRKKNPKQVCTSLRNVNFR